MVTFITFLRALAACLITNAHYTKIYPTDFIANGGLLGDVLFFAVSGWCLYNIKDSFPKWYAKRIVRVYIPVIVITAFYLIIGAYTLTERNPNYFSYFVFPTYYHFVASIVLLYIPFYITIKISILKRNIPLVMLCVFAVYLAIYIFAYDKSRYHIDTVREPMIRFLFMESMLLGAWFREHDSKIRNSVEKPIFCFVSAVATFLLYMGSKLFFSKTEKYCSMQIVNQVLLFICLYFVFRLFAVLDKKLGSLPSWLGAVVNFIADRTLEIYCVQYVLIYAVRERLAFPINWFVLTGSIIAAACILRMLTQPIVKKLCYCIDLVFDNKRAIKQ